MNNLSKKRIGKRELVSLLERCSEKDKLVLESLSTYRYLLTSQVQRLYFRDELNKLTALKRTNRCLRKLADWGLITTLKRRIGGVRAGSSSYVWTLTIAGAKLRYLLNSPESKSSGRKDKATLRGYYEPSPYFLQHTLAVAEVSIRLTELAAKGKIGISARQTEPSCWRNYVNHGGTVSTLRPDLFAVTTDMDSDYEDHWFFEVDLATESPAVVVRKCLQYLSYLRSGEEQRSCGVFPRVVWIVPTTKRKGSLSSHIAEALVDDAVLFTVITLDELEPLVINEANNDSE